MVDPAPSADAPLGANQRHIPLENALNFRDIGGYPTADGRHVRWGRMFRAGGLSTLSGADLAVLRELGIVTVLDLRSTAEWESGRFPIDELPVALHHLPVVEEILDPTRYQMAEGMMAARYQEVAQIGASPIAQAISIVADAATHPIVVHCLAGKDRTGIVVALVLSLLGVDDDTVAEDYALSNLAMAALRTRAELDALPRLRSAEVSDEVFSARPTNMTTLFESLRAKHGSIEAYVTSAGVKPAAIDSLRMGLLE
jgi:protein tyrosine/serine phosphatase